MEYSEVRYAFHLLHLPHHFVGQPLNRRQITADDFDDSRNPGERVPNLVGQAGGQLAKCRQAFSTRHLGAMHGFNLLTALSQLLHHVIEIPAQIEVLRQGRVRRAKLYYLRGLKGKSARLKRVDSRVETPETVAPANE